MLSIHKNAGAVLIHCLLTISYIWDIFNDNFVIYLDWSGEKNLIWCQYIVNAWFFTQLLGLEATWMGQIHAVIVSQVVIRHYTVWFDSSTHQKIGHHGLEFGLTRLEIIPNYEYFILFCEFNNSWHKGVLRASIYERTVLHNSC